MRLITFLKDLWYGVKIFPISVIASIVLAFFILGLEDQELFGESFYNFAMSHFPTAIFALVFSLWLHFREHVEQIARKSTTWSAVLIFGFILDWVIQDFAAVEYGTAGAVTIIFFLVAAISIGILNFTAHKFRPERILYQVAIRLLLTYVFSTVLFFGLLLALGGLNLLLNIDVPGYVYFRMAVFVQIVGATLILVGLSADLKSQDLQEEANSVIVRLFNYILIPMTAIYVLITLGYLFRSWFGEGTEAATLTWLSLGYIAFAFFTFLVGNLLPEEKNGWWTPNLKRAKLVFMMLILLSMAAGTVQLISQYGFTINRLMLMLFSLWFGISMVLLFKNPNQTRQVFQSLALITLIGIFLINQIPVKSQMNRLAAIIPTPTAANNTFTIDEQEEITSIVEYLLQNHPAEARLSSFLGIDFDSSLTNEYQKSAFILGDILGISDVSKLNEQQIYYLSEPSVLGAGFYRLQFIELTKNFDHKALYSFSFVGIDEIKYELSFDASLSTISVLSVADGNVLLSQSFLPSFEKRLLANLTQVDDKVTPFTLEFENEQFLVNLVVTKADVVNNKIRSIAFDAYLRLKQ
jgi:hypothetical protein